MPFVVSVSNRERRLGAESSPFDELRANEETYVTVITARSTSPAPDGPYDMKLPPFTSIVTPVT